MARRKNKKSAAGALIAVLCVIGIILVFAFGTQGDFISNLKQIWNNTISYGHSSSAQSVSSLVAPEDSDKLLLYVMDTGNSDSMVLRTPDGQDNYPSIHSDNLPVLLIFVQSYVMQILFLFRRTDSS